MTDPRINNNLFWYQIQNINRMINGLLDIDFSNLNEVKELRRQLIVGITASEDTHMRFHTGLEEFHDCLEYQARSNFGNKLLRIIDETIADLERPR